MAAITPQVGREVLDAAGKAVRVGVTTDEIDRVVRRGSGRVEFPMTSLCVYVCVLFVFILTSFGTGLVLNESFFCLAVLTLRTLIKSLERFNSLGYFFIFYICFISAVLPTSGFIADASFLCVSF